MRVLGSSWKKGWNEGLRGTGKWIVVSGEWLVWLGRRMSRSKWGVEERTKGTKRTKTTGTHPIKLNQTKSNQRLGRVESGRWLVAGKTQSGPVKPLEAGQCNRANEFCGAASKCVVFTHFRPDLRRSVRPSPTGSNQIKPNQTSRGDVEEVQSLKFKVQSSKPGSIPVKPSPTSLIWVWPETPQS
jgi:hypothetical protein